jgi:hypothetical protein
VVCCAGFMTTAARCRSTHQMTNGVQLSDIVISCTSCTIIQAFTWNVVPTHAHTHTPTTGSTRPAWPAAVMTTQQSGWCCSQHAYRMVRAEAHTQKALVALVLVLVGGCGHKPSGVDAATTADFTHVGRGSVEAVRALVQRVLCPGAPPPPLKPSPSQQQQLLSLSMPLSTGDAETLPTVTHPAPATVNVALPDLFELSIVPRCVDTAPRGVAKSELCFTIGPPTNKTSGAVASVSGTSGVRCAFLMPLLMH